MDNKDYEKSEDLDVQFPMHNGHNYGNNHVYQTSKCLERKDYLNAFFISSFEGSSFSACVNASTAPL